MNRTDEHLIESFVANTLPDSELAKIKARISTDSDFRDRLVEAIDTHALIQTVALEDAEPNVMRDTVEIAIGSERPGNFNDQILNALGAPNQPVQPPAKPKRHLRRVLLLTLPAWAAAVIVLATLYSALPKYGSSVATVTHASLPISVDRDGKQFQLTPGKTIRDGDYLTIPKDGAFGFSYDDDTKVEVTEGSRIQFSGNETNKQLYLSNGRIDADVTPQTGAPFAIRSPVGSAIVVGTRLSYSVEPHKGSLTVSKGSVRLVSRTGDSLEVDEGQTGIIYAGKSPVLIDPIAERASKIAPSNAQVAWQRLEFGGLIELSAEKLVGPQEVQLHPEQWILACKSAGMRQVVLSVKRSDGLCLWPSAQTTHNISQSAWRNGKGDLVREVADACKTHGLAFGISFTPRDKREKTFGSGAPYNQHVADLLTELCQNYGSLSEVRIPSGGEGEQAYDRKKWLTVIRKLQPNAVASIRGPDARWTGRTDLNAEWSIVPILKPAHASEWPDRNESNLGSLEQIKPTTPLQWMPATTNQFVSEKGDAERLLKQFAIYESTVGNNRKFLLELRPADNGELSRQTTTTLRALGQTLSMTYSRNMAERAEVRASKAPTNNPGHGPETILDGDPDTYWTADDWTGSAQLIITLPKPTTFNRINLQEPIRHGQRIESFEIDAWYNGFWRQIASGATIGHRKIVAVDSTTTDQIRLRFTKARVAPALAEFSIHHTPKRSPAITRGADGKIRLGPNPDGDVHYTLDGSVPTADSPIYRTPLSFANGGIIRARIMKNGHPASLTATADYPAEKHEWKLVAATSVSDNSSEKAEHAIDDDPRTIWHSNYAKGSPTTKHPHALTFDMGTATTVHAFGYTPRTDGPVNGTVSHMTFETSLDGTAWTQQATGSYAPGDAHRLKLQCAPHKARYVRFTAHAEINDREWASAAELDVWTDPTP